MVRRRRFLATAGVAPFPALAGCDGTTCGPGETAIEAVAAETTGSVTVEGTITELDESRIVLSDGTGEALLVSLQGYDTSTASPGDCAIATGTVVDASASGDYDLTLRTESVRVTGG